MSEPMVSHDVVAFYLLSQEVAKHVKVVQSGQGADEVFAGYHWYPPMLEPGAASDGGVLAYSRAFFDRPDEAMDDVVAAAHRCPDDASGTFVSRHFARPGASTPIDRALRIDSEIMLVDDPVKRVDNMTMAWGLEARVPFLDHDLVELAAACPPELKVAQGGKGVLKEAARRVIPAEVIDRPKGYFPVPALTHLEGPLFDMVRDALTDPAAKQRGLFRTDLRRSAARRPERRAHPAARQQAVAARAARAVAAEPRDHPVSERRAVNVAEENRPDRRPGDDPPATYERARREDAEGGAMPHRLVGGWDRHDAISTTSWQEPPEHLVASMARDVVVDMGWGRVLFGQTFRSAAAHRRPPARRGRGPPRHLPVRPRPARARGQGATGAVRRPVVHLPVLAAPGHAPPRPAARRRRAGARHPRGRRRRQPHLRALRHGPGARRRAVGQPAGPPHHLPRGRGRPHGRADRHRDGHRPHPRLRRPRGRDLAVDAWRSIRRRRSPAWAKRSCGPSSSASTPGAAPTSTCRCMHDNEPAIALYDKLGFERVPVFAVKRKNAINERLFVGDARGPRRPQPVRPDHRRRGPAPGRDGRGGRRPGGRDAPVPRRAQHRDPRVAVRADDRGGDEPLRRQAPHPAHPRPGGPAGGRRVATPSFDDDDHAFLARRRRGGGEARPGRAGRGHHRRRRPPTTSSTSPSTPPAPTAPTS